MLKKELKKLIKEMQEVANDLVEKSNELIDLMVELDQNIEKKLDCCKHYNGDVDITNSCIFCKTYLGKKDEK